MIKYEPGLAKIIDVDTRPSDGIALAVQTGAPIFVEEHVLNEVCESFDISDIDFDFDVNDEPVDFDKDEEAGEES